MSKRSKIIKKLKNSSAYKDAETLDYAENDDVIIPIGLKNVEDFFNPYSYKDYELVNPAVLNFIYDNEKTIPISENISIDIHTEYSTTNADKKRIRETMKRQHAEQVIVVTKKLKNNLFSGFLSFILGVLILALALYIENSQFFMSNILINTLMITAWVFVWHSVELWFIQRPQIKTLLIKNYRLMNARVHVRKYSYLAKSKKETMEKKSEKQNI